MKSSVNPQGNTVPVVIQSGVAGSGQTDVSGNVVISTGGATYTGIIGINTGSDGGDGSNRGYVNIGGKYITLTGIVNYGVGINNTPAEHTDLHIGGGQTGAGGILRLNTHSSASADYQVAGNLRYKGKQPAQAWREY